MGQGTDSPILGVTLACIAASLVLAAMGERRELVESCQAEVASDGCWSPANPCVPRYVWPRR